MTSNFENVLLQTESSSTIFRTLFSSLHHAFQEAVNTFNCPIKSLFFSRLKPTGHCENYRFDNLYERKGTHVAGESSDNFVKYMNVYISVEM